MSRNASSTEWDQHLTSQEWDAELDRHMTSSVARGDLNEAGLVQAYEAIEQSRSAKGREAAR